MATKIIDLQKVQQLGQAINLQVNAFLHETLDKTFGRDIVDLYEEDHKMIPEAEMSLHQHGNYPRMTFEASIKLKGKLLARRRFTTIPDPKQLPIIKIEDMNTRILITGAAGFIGHHVVEHILKNTNWDIVVLDKLTYAASGLDRLRDIKVFDGKRVTVYTCDITQPIEAGLLQEIGQVDYILHMGAETHVDNSIKDPRLFVQANVVGTLEILMFARTQSQLKKFIYFSTDEVFGPAPEGRNFKEWDRYNSGNPYSATKAAGEELAISFANTYKIPVVITHTMNVFGERQHPEKFIPKTVKQILKGETITIHSDQSKTIPGSRYWIHARNVAAAIMFLIEKEPLLNDFEPAMGKVSAKPAGTYSKLKAGEKKGMWMPVSKWNIVGEKETNNLELAQLIYKSLEKRGLTPAPFKYEMVDFHSSRPGHDLRYALDGQKLKDAGFELPMGFEETLDTTIGWMVSPEWSKWLK